MHTPATTVSDGRIPGPRQASPTSYAEPDRGFTLVEILIAIVLVGILSAVVVVAIGRLTDTASAASCATSADAARVASNAYLVDHSTYAPTLAALTAPVETVDALLSLPSGATAVGNTISTATWTLTMSTTTPPTFECSAVGTGVTTTALATTTAVPTTTAPTTVAPTVPSGTPNGVTATPSVDRGDRAYFGDNEVSISNKAPLTAMTVTITVAQTSGVTFQSSHHNFWQDTVTTATSTSGGSLRAVFTLDLGKTIVAGSWTLHLLWDGTGTVHPNSGDTWTVVTTSGGLTNTLSGTF